MPRSVPGTPATAAIAPLRVSVNVSPRQFQDPGLQFEVKRVIEETGIDPTWLELEITESIFFSDIKIATAALRALKEIGVGLKIDDFGTGYSSLSYLCQLPFDAVKIDQSFIHGLEIDQPSSEMVKTILAMAHELHMNVVAEGIELEDQANALDKMGCEYGQGFFFGRPMPAAQADALLNAIRPLAKLA